MIACLLPACDRGEPVDLVIRDASIVDLDSGELIAGRAVVVDDGIVRRIVPAARASDHRAAVAVDGGGRFLIPALADAHVHIRYPGELASYLRYGVGLVVNMAGGPIHLEMRQAVVEKRLEGPAIVTVGPTLDGSPPWSWARTPASAARFPDMPSTGSSRAWCVPGSPS